MDNSDFTGLLEVAARECGYGLRRYQPLGSTGYTCLAYQGIIERADMLAELIDWGYRNLALRLSKPFTVQVLSYRTDSLGQGLIIYWPQTADR